MSAHTALSARGAEIAAALFEAVIAPAAGMPPVAETDAVRFFDSYLAASPRLNRLALKFGLETIDLVAVLRHGGTLRALDTATRGRYLRGLTKGPLAPAVVALSSMGKIAYYGDDGLMQSHDYDAAARVKRGQTLRAAEGRW